ncbi:MAG: T9SS type A sorting domain-containing protein [Bacteroidetes bacterium]|nr:T9SS type A sorting domain-containing protein [Bacteroidota bacterium]
MADVPTGSRFNTRLTAVSGGGIYAYDTSNEGAPVWYSDDGGVTWEDVGPVWTAWPATVEEIVVGPDGRLYAACSGTFAGHDGGVFRTVDPVIVVAADPAVPTEETGLRVYPNPSSGTLTIEAEHDAREAVVYDLRGREVLRAALVAGKAEMDAGGLPAGVYVVRAGAFTQRITLLK